MPVPTKQAGENSDEFISRCIKELADKDPEMPNEQRIAICEKQNEMSAFSTWEDIKRQMKVRNDLTTPDKRYKNNQ